MRKNLFGLVGSGLMAAAGITLFGGLLNTAIDGSLAISVGGSTMALPTDVVSTLVSALLLAMLAGASLAVAYAEKVLGFCRARPAIALSLVAGFFLAIYGAYFQIVGGSLGVAVDNGDAARVAIALESGDYTEETLNSHLYQSLKAGHLDVAKALIAGGADPNRIAGEHESPLLADAVVWFGKDSVLLLLEQGADPKRQDKLGRTAVHTMLAYRLMNRPEDGEKGVIALLTSLESHGADLHQAATDGQSPLKIAENNGLKEVAAWLKSRPEPQQNPKAL